MEAALAPITGAKVAAVGTEIAAVAKRVTEVETTSVVAAVSDPVAKIAASFSLPPREE